MQMGWLCVSRSLLWYNLAAMIGVDLPVASVNKWVHHMWVLLNLMCLDYFGVQVCVFRFVSQACLGYYVFVDGVWLCVIGPSSMILSEGGEGPIFYCGKV